MPLTTNNCKKHGGYVEDECPECVKEEYEFELEESKEFFRCYDQYEIALRTPGDKHSITVEKLFQHFRMRLIDELNNRE